MLSLSAEVEVCDDTERRVVELDLNALLLGRSGLSRKIDGPSHDYMADVTYMYVSRYRPLFAVVVDGESRHQQRSTMKYHVRGKEPCIGRFVLYRSFFARHTPLCISIWNAMGTLKSRI